MSTTTSTAVVVYSPGDVDPEHVALAGFLGGYRGLTRDAYALDLRQFVAFCEQRQLRLFEVHRSDIEAFGHHLEARGRATATIARRLCTITGFYRYAEEEGLIAHSPAVHVRRPRIDYESHAIGLDRNEVGSLLVAAGLGSAGEHALICLLALNGLKSSGPTSRRSLSSADTAPSPFCARAPRQSPSLSRHAPPAPSTWPSANGPQGRSSPPPTAAASTVTARPGSCAASPVGPGWPNRSVRTPCATRSSPPPSTPECRCATSKRPPPTPIHAPPCP